MASERTWARVLDPGLELAFTLGDPVSDEEIDQLRELAAARTVDAAPGRQYAANWLAKIRGFPPVVVENPPGRYQLHPEITGFAADVLNQERGNREDARRLDQLLAALAELSEQDDRLLHDMCGPPRPLESALRGWGIGDPDRFVTTVNAAARRHGIHEPVVESSAWTVRATSPPDLLVGAVLMRQHRKHEKRQRDRLAAFVEELGPDESALLRNLAGFDMADDAPRRGLDPAGEVLNERARSAGLTGAADFPDLLRRDDRGQWRVHPPALQHLRALFSAA